MCTPCNYGSGIGFLNLHMYYQNGHITDNTVFKFHPLILFDTISKQLLQHENKGTLLIVHNYDTAEKL